jgi:hypothetical protein
LAERFRRRWLAIAAAACAAACAAPAHAQPTRDWLDDMPDVATVALAIDRVYGGVPEQQSTVAINTAAALILLRQLLRYQADEDAGMTPERAARMRAIEDEYLLAELAIGRTPGARRGSLSASEAQQFYESRRYAKCAPADCYRYWLRFQLEYWNALPFRRDLLPLLFPCGRAPALLELAAKHALDAPLIPFTPAAPLPGDTAELARLRALERPAAACTADGSDVDGDRQCSTWEASLQATRAAFASAAGQCPVLTLENATTRDAASVTVRYTAGPGLAGRPIRLTACRATIPTVTRCEGPLTKPIGAATLAAAEDLAPGWHEVTILEDRVLAPDTSVPYVVVVGDAAGQTSRTYFHKWMMGVVIHGYTYRLLLALASVNADVETEVREFLLGNDEVEPWQAEMVATLKSTGCYDGATFAFNWRSDSTLSVATILQQRAAELYGEITRRAINMTYQHFGDVVDVHLIGHSRGTVIISEALKQWKARPNIALAGSHLRVTLLDPHPANNAISPQEDHDPTRLPGFFYPRYREVQGFMNDPLVELPGGIGLREAEVWYQHSRVQDIMAAPVVRDSELFISGINLWGLGGTIDLITPRTDPSVNLLWRNITSFTLADGSVVDHPRVADYYQAELRRNAVPGRCVVPVR